MYKTLKKVAAVVVDHNLWLRDELWWRMRCLVFRQHHYILQISSQSTLLLSGQVLKCKDASSFKSIGMGIFIDETWGVKKSGLVLVGGWDLMNVPRGVQLAGSDVPLSSARLAVPLSSARLAVPSTHSSDPPQSGGLEVPSLSAPIALLWSFFTSAWYFCIFDKEC